MRAAAGLALAGLAAALLPAGALGDGPCPNMCNGHGLCHGNQCTCFDGWMGGDCSLRTCPLGKAWADAAVASDDAHRPAECSNRGKCDRESGQCICDTGFTGKSCELTTCPNNCWDRGRCVSMFYNARYKDPGYGTIYDYSTPWDAGRIFGCICDDGFHGFDCSLRDCNRGDDPMTTGQLDEIQLVKCRATNGFFTLTFNGHTSEPIPASSLIDDFVTIVEAIPGLGSISVAFAATGVTVCSTTQVVSITFLEQFGDVPSLVVKSSSIASCSDPEVANYDLCGGPQTEIVVDGATASFGAGTISSRQGTKENEFCSRRGHCDVTTGICGCYSNYITSDGRGNVGDRGDCGYPNAEIQACPGLISCSGHGVCSNAPEYRCTCSAGWSGGDCSDRTCPIGKSWFDLPISNNRAHQLSECSDRGVCDRATSDCNCHTGFKGGACDQIECPGFPTECSGHGTCLTMSQLAENALINGDLEPTTYGNVPNNPLTWDYESMHGCQCDIGWEGHDCSLRSCPRGDNPDTGIVPGEMQYHESQLIQCTADGGNLVLYFRTLYTEPIPYDAGEIALKAALVALDSITDVTITYSSGTELCTIDGSNVATVTFTQELGDVPALRGFASTVGADLSISAGSVSLDIASDGGTLGGLTAQQGTMENAVCSDRGICDHELGECTCFYGYGSSNGNLDAGDRGDCGYKLPYLTGEETTVVEDES